MVAAVALLAVTIVDLAERPLLLLVAVVCLGVAIAAAAYALTRARVRRLLGALVAVLALAAPLVLVVAYGRLLRLLLLIALAAIAVAATRYGLGRDSRSLKSGSTPGAVVGPAIRPVLLLNPNRHRPGAAARTARPTRRTLCPALHRPRRDGTSIGPSHPGLQQPV